MTTNDNTSAPPLDLDAVEARARDNEDFRTYHLAQDSADDVPALLAEVRRLRGLLDAETAAHRGDLRDDAKALDDLVAQVWRAAGETHEPPADVAALLRRVAEDHKALVGFRRAMLDACEALDGVRPEPDFDMPAELGSYACDEVARLKVAAAAARREGAEAMREAAAEECEVRAVERGSNELQYAANAIRALPLPEAPR